MASTKRIDLYVQPALIISLGGLGGAVNLVAKNAINATLGELGISWVRHIHIDFPNASDPIPEGIRNRYKAIQNLSNAETIELNIDPVQDLARSESRDPAYEPLWKLCPRAVSARSLSQQAGQIPSLGRAALWFGLPRVVNHVEENLRQLAPAGDVVTNASRLGFRSNQIASNISIWIANGAQGGMGNGGALQTAVVVSAVAKAMGIPCTVNATVAFGYRPTQDAEADRRAALGEQFAQDLEAVQEPGKKLLLTGYNGREFSASTPIFRRIVVTEAPGRLYANAGAIATMMGNSLAFRVTKLAAHQIETAAEQNVLHRLREGHI